MADYQQIYRERAADYHRLVAAEDASGALGGWLGGALPEGADEVLDAGAGTGRVAALVARARPGARLVCADAAPAMLEELARRWPTDLGSAPETVVADYRDLPFASARFDAVTAGWALGHLTGFHPDRWREEARRALDELTRVTRRGGVVAIFETLGTGAPAPRPPRGDLGALYALFEADGFSRTELRTDYRFGSRAEAEALATFFFGESMVAHLRDDAGGVTLIEWTGAWRREVV